MRLEAAILRRTEGVMHNSRRYRGNAVDCLQAARDAREPHYKRLFLLMAQSWLSLATQDEATDDLLASWSIAADRTVLPFPSSATKSIGSVSTRPNTISGFTESFIGRASNPGPGGDYSANQIQSSAAATGRASNAAPATSTLARPSADAIRVSRWAPIHRPRRLPGQPRRNASSSKTAAVCCHMAMLTTAGCPEALVIVSLSKRS